MNKIIKGLSIASLVYITRSLPFNWIVGTTSWFSWSSMCAPVLAAHVGFSWLALFFISPSIVGISSLGFFLLHRLPLVGSAWVFQKQDIYTSVVLPIVCMMLFVVHPVGQGAWLYSLYWLIPVIAHFVAHNTVWVRSLKATFVAHALGSVLSLYTGTMSSEIWLGLIPIVAYERLLMVLGMVVFDTIYSFIMHWLYQYSALFFLRDQEE